MAARREAQTSAHSAGRPVSTAQRPKLHSGEGHLASNLIAFVLCAALLLAGIGVLYFASLNTVWPFSACIALFGLAYFIPKMILGRSDIAVERH